MVSAKVGTIEEYLLNMGKLENLLKREARQTVGSYWFEGNKLVYEYTKDEELQEGELDCVPIFGQSIVDYSTKILNRLGQIEIGGIGYTLDDVKFQLKAIKVRYVSEKRKSPYVKLYTIKDLEKVIWGKGV